MSILKFIEEIEKIQKLPLEEVKMTAVGNVKAKFRTAYLYTTGTNPDYKKAFEFFDELAKENIPEAQFNLGIMYFNGHGVEKNDAIAKKWFEKAAEQELEEAKLILKLYYNT